MKESTIKRYRFGNDRIYVMSFDEFLSKPLQSVPIAANMGYGADKMIGELKKIQETGCEITVFATEYDGKWYSDTVFIKMPETTAALKVVLNAVGQIHPDEFDELPEEENTWRLWWD